MSTSERIGNFYKDWIYPFDPGDTVRALLRASFEIDRTPSDFALIIERNQMFSQFLANCDFIKNRKDLWNDGEDFKKSESVSVSRACNFLGRQLVRNLVMTIAINRLKGQGLPRRGGEKLILPIETELKCALQAQEQAEQLHAGSHEYAFAAGFVYDFLRTLLEKTKAPADAKKEWQEGWTRGIEIAKDAHQLAKGILKFEFGHLVYTAGLLSQLHRPFMALLYPKGSSTVSWADLQKKKESAKTTTDFFAYRMEINKSLEINPSQVRALVFRTLGIFTPFEEALVHIDDPAALTLKNTNPQQRLAQLITLADLKTKKLAWTGWATKHAEPLGLKSEAAKK